MIFRELSRTGWCYEGSPMRAVLFLVSRNRYHCPATMSRAMIGSVFGNIKGSTLPIHDHSGQSRTDNEGYWLSLIGS